MQSSDVFVVSGFSRTVVVSRTFVILPWCSAGISIPRYRRSTHPSCKDGPHVIAFDRATDQTSSDDAAANAQERSRHSARGERRDRHSRKHPRPHTLGNLGRATCHQTVHCPAEHGSENSASVFASPICSRSASLEMSPARLRHRLTQRRRAEGERRDHRCDYVTHNFLQEADGERFASLLDHRGSIPRGCLDGCAEKS